MRAWWLSCRDVGGEDPVAGDRPQLVLATARIAGSGTTATEPPSPLAAHIEFGVQSDPPDYSQGAYPHPLIFRGHVMTGDDVGEAFSCNSTNTPGFGVVERRLTDGIEEEGYFALFVDGVFGSGTFGDESVLFEFNPELTRTGPDFQAFDVTRIVIVLNALSTTPVPNDRWRTDYDVEIRIMGRIR